VTVEVVPEVVRRCERRVIAVDRSSHGSWPLRPGVAPKGGSLDVNRSCVRITFYAQIDYIDHHNMLPSSRHMSAINKSEYHNPNTSKNIQKV
jgi:hypothetical protein